MTTLQPPCPSCGNTAGLFLGDSPYCAACSCDLCHDTGEILIPFDADDVDTRPCPQCTPEAWPSGFPGIATDEGVWIIPPIPTDGLSG